MTLIEQILMDTEGHEQPHALVMVFNTCVAVAMGRALTDDGGAWFAWVPQHYHHINYNECGVLRTALFSDHRDLAWLARLISMEIGVTVRYRGKTA